MIFLLIIYIMVEKKRKKSKSRNKYRNKYRNKSSSINKTRSKKTVEMEKILVGTIDIDLDNRVKKGGVQKGGAGEFRTRDLPEILWRLFATLFRRTQGPPTEIQANRRRIITDALRDAFGDVYGEYARNNVAITLQMKTEGDNPGLLIKFYMTPRRSLFQRVVDNWTATGLMTQRFHPFHISIHDNVCEVTNMNLLYPPQQILGGRMQQVTPSCGFNRGTLFFQCGYKPEKDGEGRIV